uniref:Junctophilin-1 n=1 Tax=Scolopendra viridis TaxID=118503 RepID=A0A4D5R9S2_SCOVI
MQQGSRAPISGGRFDFDDGGTYCGGWEDGKAHGHGVCTGPKGQGEYSGSWHYGFEVSGVYTWPSGSTYDGHWQNGKRHGLGVETRGRWVYRGEWTQGFKGRYGVRQSTTSGAKYEGTWANGLQDGYGSETYADGGTFQGQWLRGMRHGYGVRTSAPFGLASHYRSKAVRESTSSLRSESVAGDPASERDRKIDDCRGGFVLKAKSDEPPARRRSLVEKSTNLKKSILQGLRIKKQRSTGDIDKRGTSGSIRSTGSSTSWASTESGHSGLTTGSHHTDSNVSFVSQDDIIDGNVTETYMGEWKNDKRSGFGISERSDGLRYEGEWYNNKKYGYGVTTFKDGTKEEGKYKNNVLITSNKKKHIFLIRSAKFRERVDSAVNAAIRASQIALQKADIAISRTATARGKSEQADIASKHAQEDSDFARLCASQFAPEFQQPGSELLKKRFENIVPTDYSKLIQSAGSGYPPSQSVYGQPPPTSDYNVTNPRAPEINDRRSAVQPTVEGNPHLYDRVPHDSLNPHQAYSKVSNYINPTILTENEVGHQINESTSFNVQNSFRREHRPSIRGDDPRYSISQALADHFDQYKIEPARDLTSFSTKSQFMTEIRPPPPKNPYGTDWTPDSGVSESMDNEDSPTRPNRRSTLPNLLPSDFSGNDSVGSLAPSDLSVGSSTGDDTLRKRAGVPSGPSLLSPNVAVGSPARTSSLYNNPPSRKPQPQPQPSGRLGGGGGGGGGQPPRRKKSLPDSQQLPKQIKMMSREEVSVLSTQRREEVRRQMEEAERYRANPLLYIFNPSVKDWLSRQQLVMLVLFINISLAIMFFKLLT